MLSKSSGVFLGINSKIERTFDGGEVKTFHRTKDSWLSCNASEDSKRSCITVFAIRSISSIGCIAINLAKVARVSSADFCAPAIEKSSSLS